MSAALISSMDLTCRINAFLLAGPTPGISSSTDFTWDLLRSER